MRKRSQQGTRIICIHSLKDYAGQEHFAGVLDFCRKRIDWSVRVIDPDDLDEATMRRIVTSDPDGVIISLPGTPAAMNVLLATKIPIVLANIGGCRLPLRNRRISQIWTDNADVGERGARYFLSLADFRSYAFAGTADNCFWSVERGRAFCQQIRNAGRSCEYHNVSEQTDSWLTALPKPTAVMAANDTRAAEIIEACIRKNLHVPKQVAVLGADNEPTRRKHSKPQISTVPIDFFRMGFCEAEELFRLLSEKGARGNPEILVPAGEVIQRQSTRVDTRADELVRQIHDYISDNALAKVKITDLVKTLGCSRRLAELRFRQTTGHSIYQEILDVRLQQVRRLLSTTDLTLDAIASSCGYASGKTLSRAILSELGTTAALLRQQADFPGNALASSGAETRKQPRRRSDTD